MRCPRCGHEEADQQRYCPECWLEVNPTGEETDPRIALLRHRWEREHVEQATLYAAWTREHAPEEPPPGETSPVPRPAEPDRPRPPLRPAAGRLRAVLVVFAAIAVYQLLVIVSDLMEIDLSFDIEAGNYTTAELDANDRRQLLVSLGHLALLVSAAVVWIRWFHRAYANVDAIGGERRYGTGWAIGGWFVPFLALWRPKEIANDIWRATGHRPDVLLFAWWGAWLISSFGSRVWQRLEVDSPASLRTQDYVDIGLSVLSVVGAVLACLVAARGTERMEAAAAKLP